MQKPVTLQKNIMGVNAKPLGKGSWILAIILGAVFLFKQFGGSEILSGDSTENVESVNALLLDEELIYTKHAKCRMDCREIDKSEVEDILQNGKVNWNKSDANDSPCASYSLEGKTKDGQTVRIVFADCNNATKVITAIDLKNDYDCYCE